MNKKVRVRFAPSPTGPLHIGGLRTALYNYLFAQKHGGDFILRIEDTDQNRFVAGAEEYIINSLSWCGILPNEGQGIVPKGEFAPYKQSERTDHYKKYAQQLIESEHAYYAFDTPEAIAAMRAKKEGASYNYITRSAMTNSLTLPKEKVKAYLAAGKPYVIRLKIPRGEEIRFKDIIRDNMVVHTAQIDDKVLFKSDGLPTYHLASVVDDYLMGITHVIRGEEWLPSASLHVLLYKCLGWEDKMPEFAHLPLILKPGKEQGKLSKRDGDSLGFPVFPLAWTDPESKQISSGYKEKGYFPEALVNMLALLGWNPGTTEELFTLEELAAAFSLERVSKHGAKFDPAKALWFNAQYLRKKSPEALKEAFAPLLQSHGMVAEPAYVSQVLDLIKEKANFVHELWEHGCYFFQDPETLDTALVSQKWQDQAPDFVLALAVALKNLPQFTAEAIQAAFKTTALGIGLKPTAFMPICRLCLSGVLGGPDLFAMVQLLGREVVVRRLQKAPALLTKAMQNG